MTPSLEGSPTKAKEAPPREVRLAPLDTNRVFQCLGDNRLSDGKMSSDFQMHNFPQLKKILGFTIT